MCNNDFVRCKNISFSFKLIATCRRLSTINYCPKKKTVSFSAFCHFSFNFTNRRYIEMAGNLTWATGYRNTNHVNNWWHRNHEHFKRPSTL